MWLDLAIAVLAFASGFWVRGPVQRWWIEAKTLPQGGEVFD